MAKEMRFPDGSLWGEKAWEAFARPCQIFLEDMNKNIDKVYRTCIGEKAWEAFARPCQIFLEGMNKISDKVYRTCKMPWRHT